MIDKETDIQCPFCQENGFDLMGLKEHLLTDCEAFKRTMSIEEEIEIWDMERELEKKCRENIK